MAKLIGWALVLVLAMFVVGSSTAAAAAAADPPHKKAPPATPPPSSSVDCSSVVLDMTDCLDYVSKGSNASKPGAACCSGVKAVVNVSPTCLCVGLKEASGMGIDVDMTRALKLPAACSVSIPDLGNCAAPPPHAKTPSPSPAPSSSSPPPPSPASLVGPVSPAQPPPADSGVPTPASSQSSSMLSPSPVLVAILTAALAVTGYYHF